MSDTTDNTPNPGYVTYGGVNDRPDDVNHPDNVAPERVSTDPTTATTAGVPNDFHYDPDTDTYYRNNK